MAGGLSLVPSLKDLIHMKELLETGKVVPLIVACCPLEKTTNAFRYYGQSHPRGKVVIKIQLKLCVPERQYMNRMEEI